MIAYEELLSRDLQWALREGSMHFEKGSAVHTALTRICRKLEELNIPYAVVGGMAMFFHGYRRFTDDVDLLVTRDGLRKAHEHLEGLGYVPPFEGSKQLRDTEHGVRVEFLVAGEYPGDGKPKPVVFPDPTGKTIEAEGMRLLNLPTLIELKLASGISNPRRGQDLVDVQKLIENLKLPLEFADQINPYVREKFKEIWNLVHDNPP